MNKLFKKVKELKGSEFHQQLIKIVEAYPLLDNHETEFKPVENEVTVTPLEPKIIISESFTA